MLEIRKPLLILLATALPLSYSYASKGGHHTHHHSPKKVKKGHQGEPFVHKKPMTVSEVLKTPAKLKDKHIQVRGTIKKVCPMAGCWVDMEDPKTKKQIHVKVKDGEIVFPKTAKGKKATVEGRLVERKMTQKKAIKYYKHRAEELGIPFDPKTITGPVSIWEIKGVAAKVDESKKSKK